MRGATRSSNRVWHSGVNSRSTPRPLDQRRSERIDDRVLHQERDSSPKNGWVPSMDSNSASRAGIVLLATIFHFGSVGRAGSQWPWRASVRLIVKLIETEYCRIGFVVLF